MRQNDPPPPDVLPVGTVLGDAYKLTRLIGYGGMGAVFEAKQLASGKSVAIKVMSRELAAYPEALARFRREVKVTTELAHPNIIDVVDFGAAPTGEPYLVMEYLEGEDLERCLIRVERLRLPTAVQIINQLASALASSTAISNRRTCSWCAFRAARCSSRSSTSGSRRSSRRRPRS
jgi:serine/threonine protein kinase